MAFFLIHVTFYGTVPTNANVDHLDIPDFTAHFDLCGNHTNRFFAAGDVQYFFTPGTHEMVMGFHTLVEPRAPRRHGHALDDPRVGKQIERAVNGVG